MWRLCHGVNDLTRGNASFDRNNSSFFLSKLQKEENKTLDHSVLVLNWGVPTLADHSKKSQAWNSLIL